MRRYRLDISDREFVIDVQEITADRFSVQVGEDAYEVQLSGDENLAEAAITPGYQPAMAAPSAPVITRVKSERPAAAPAAAAPAAPVAAPKAPRPAVGGGKSAVTAPMPGVIIEVSVKAGDQLERGQQVAVLDAMKMHNVIGSPRAGIVGEVFVAAGQSVDHGDAIIKFRED